MKTELGAFGKNVVIVLPKVVSDQLGLKPGDEVTLDIPMVHKGMLCVEKVNG